MNLDLLPLLALAPYAAVAVGLAVTLLLFLSVKADLHRTAKRERLRVDAALARLQDAHPSVEREPVLVPASGVTGINLHRRVHALRLLRKGEDLSHIAAVLGISRKEVELLVRVQDFVGERQISAAAGGAD